MQFAYFCDVSTPTVVIFELPVTELCVSLPSSIGTCKAIEACANNASLEYLLNS